MKKILLLLALMLVGVVTLTACDDATHEEGALRFRPLTNVERPDVTPGILPTALPWPGPTELMERRPVALQLTPMTPGEEIVVFETNHGQIVMRLFPQAAPLAVENFMTHVANGFYDGLIFHRVIEGFMIQGGCAEGTGRAGQSIWGVGFSPEHNYDLWHFNGALAMAQTNAWGSIGSQFYIVHRSFLPGGFASEFASILEIQDEIIYPANWDGVGPHLKYGDVFLREVFEHFLEVGGTPDLDFPFNSSGPNMGHTVFGQVVQGMEVVNSIAATRTGANDRPVDDVIINRAFIAVYEGE